MKKENLPGKKTTGSIKKGYNEENPGQPQGAFPPGSNQESKKTSSKSNTADKKAKEGRS
jgi:hypothetical protein